jgi:protein SCO1/2
MTSRALISNSRAMVAALSAALLAALAIGACGGGGSDSTSTTAAPKFEGAVATPPKPPPGLALRNYNGRALDASSLRGKAVLVTFIYTHCPDVCPLIVSHLHAAQDDLGPKAKKMQIIAVSVDPRGDTPKTVAAFLKAHQMSGRMDYLIGSRPQLERVWRDWNIVSRNDPKAGNPDFVEHSAEIYGISGSGKITTLYPANFKPAQIVHDVPLLAAQ